MSPVVLCIDMESYVAAVAAMEHLAEKLGPSEVASRQAAAVQDFKRAHTASLAWEARIQIPALLKRQAG